MNVTKFLVGGPLLVIVFALSACTDPQQDTALDRTGTLWHPYLEWRVENASYDGNPFDIEARVTFEHPESGVTHTTEMFYDGGTTWAWRFTGAQTGQWIFSSQSPDPELDGLEGTVTIRPNPDSMVHGFMTAVRSKWARPRGADRTPEAFVPQLVMYRQVDALGPRAAIEADLQRFFDEHGFNGVHIPSIGGRWFDAAAGPGVDASMVNPDPRTFEALERLITAVHAAGGVVHLWAWGDAARGWTPTELAGGMNGPADRRLQRYIAARLGPLPGWSMGYGFDLDEWAPRSVVKAWRDTLHTYLGWSHFIGGRPEGPNRGTDHSAYVAWNETLDYASYEHHRPDYDVYVAAVEAVPGKPVFSEDRFRIRTGGYPEKDYDMTRVRRGLWHSTMAGGVANIWGHLHNSPEGGGSGSFPQPAWIRTYARFFERPDRFRAEMERANGLSADANTRVLRLPDRAHYVLYREQAETLQIDLSGMDGPQPAVAVDTKAPYAEVHLGRLAPESHTLQLPHQSDWAVAIGSFGPE